MYLLDWYFPSRIKLVSADIRKDKRQTSNSKPQREWQKEIFCEKDGGTE